MILQEALDPCEDTIRLLDAVNLGRLVVRDTPEDRWLGELAQRIFGPRGPRVVGG